MSTPPPSPTTTTYNIKGCQGVTIIAASGDDGVANYGARNNQNMCGYHPIWPGASPYVLSVGATTGPEIPLEISPTLAADSRGFVYERAMCGNHHGEIVTGKSIVIN